MERSKVIDMNSLDDFKPGGICPKCGCEKMETSYCVGDCPLFKAFFTTEHLDKKCVRCGFGWAENCLNEASQKIIRESNEGRPYWEPIPN